MVRFITNTRADKSDCITNSILSISEIAGADNILYKHSQDRSFDANHSTRWKENKALKPLNPFRDPIGFLRVGGRLRNAELQHAQRHPIILQGTDELAILLIKH